MPAEPPEIVMFFDGVCGLCNHLVNFLIVRDQQQRLRYAPLQGETFQELAKSQPQLAGIDSLVVANRLPDGTTRLLIRSRGALFVLEQLGGAWKVLAQVLQMVPPPLADVAYRFVANTRYLIFGKHTSCRMPRPEERRLFLA
jgi:predicted DCC family thiol-disulfide oxidoreductase YuxK